MSAIFDFMKKYDVEDSDMDALVSVIFDKALTRKVDWIAAKGIKAKESAPSKEIRKMFLSEIPIIIPAESGNGNIVILNFSAIDDQLTSCRVEILGSEFVSMFMMTTDSGPQAKQKYKILVDPSFDVRNSSHLMECIFEVNIKRQFPAMSCVAQVESFDIVGVKRNIENGHSDI